MIILDYKDRRPLYEQIIEKYKELMVKGILPKDAKLPSVRSQAMELSINPNTIQRAYAELERQGYIYSIKGKGSFAGDISALIGERRVLWRDEMRRHIRAGYDLGIGTAEMIGLVDEESRHKEGGAQL